MGDILTCKDIEKAVELLQQNKKELPYVLTLSVHWLKRKEIVDYAQWGAKTRRFSTHFVDKDQVVIKSFMMDKI